MSRTKQLRILSMYFHPDIATTGQLLTELAIGLIAKGYRVEVITAHPLYERQEAVREEVYRGVRINRVWSTRMNKNSTIGKVLNSVTFFFSVVITLLFDDRRAPLLIVSNPPFLPLAGMLARSLRRIPFVFLVHDVYPDIAVRLGYLKKGSIFERTWDWLNRSIFSAAHDIIVLSNSMKNVIQAKAKNGDRDSVATKISVIHNWADGDFIKPIDRENNPFLRNHRLQEKFVVLYSGNLGLFHELELVIEAARRIEDRDIQFLFIGDGGKKKVLERMVLSTGVSNVLFLPYQDRALLPYSLTAASVSLVSLEEGIEGLAMPSKLYTILSAGVPIIGICDAGSDVGHIIDQAECGYSVRHHDVEGFIDRILFLRANEEYRQRLGDNGRRYCEKHFTLPHAIAQYEAVLSRICS